jgi:hypothetical protein
VFHEIIPLEESFESLNMSEAQRGRYLESVTKKYAHLMDGLTKPRDKQLIAALCENQKVYEDSTTGNLPISVFPTKFAFPIITQVFPDLVANKLARVYPMTAPIGRVYYKHYTDASANSLTHSGSYAQNTEAGTVKTGRMALTSLDISAQKFILQALYSTELAEDAAAMGNINVEQDLLAALAEEILGEIDSLVLADMVAGATAGTVVYSSAQLSGESPKDAAARLYQSIVQADVDVQLKRFHPTNYIIGHPNAVAKLRNLDTFAISNGAMQSNFALGVRHFGDFAGQWEVYSAPLFPNTTQLMVGTRGLGYIFAPYVALELMPTFYDNTTDQWLRNIRMRAAKKVTIGDEFALVTLT